MRQLTGRRVVVTGGSGGIGYAVTAALARQGAHVTITSRSATRAIASATALRQLAGAGNVDGQALDLADLRSVRAFAAIMLAAGPLDLLINNAGVMGHRTRQLTPEGWELQLGTNHGGHFALTGLLLPALLRAEAAPARIVCVASIAHRRGVLQLDDLGFSRGYRPMAAYAQSKLANLMFALELQRRLQRAGAHAMALAAHPGIAATNLADTIARDRGWMAGMVVRAAFAAFGQSADRGAAPILYAATAPGIAGGTYWGPDGWREMRGAPAPAVIAAQARDGAGAAALWCRSEQLTGIAYLN